MRTEARIVRTKPRPEGIRSHLIQLERILRDLCCSDGFETLTLPNKTRFHGASQAIRDIVASSQWKD